MKIFSVFLVIPAGLILSGCATQRPAAVNNSSHAAAPIITPDYSLSAKVISVNTVGRFVVLSFPTSGLPKVDQSMYLYRGGLKVAEVRITGPQQENNIVADIVSGDARTGDSVSEN